MEALMDAIQALATQSQAVVATMETSDLHSDALEISGLMLRVVHCVTRAANTGRPCQRQLCAQQEALAALQGVSDALARCVSCIATIASKGQIMRFVRADTYMGEIRSACQGLAQQLTSLQAAMHLDERAFLQDQIEQLKADLSSVRLERMQALQANWQRIHAAVKQQLREQQWRVDTPASAERLRWVVMQGLARAGMLQAVCAGSA